MDILMACPSKERSSSLEGFLGNSIPCGWTSRGYTPLPCTKKSTRAGLAAPLPAASSWRMKGARYRPPKPRVAPRKKVRRLLIFNFCSFVSIKRNRRQEARLQGPENCLFRHDRPYGRPAGYWHRRGFRCVP